MPLAEIRRDHRQHARVEAPAHVDSGGSECQPAGHRLAQQRLEPLRDLVVRDPLHRPVDRHWIPVPVHAAIAATETHDVTRQHASDVREVRLLGGQPAPRQPGDQGRPVELHRHLRLREQRLDAMETAARSALHFGVEQGCAPPGSRAHSSRSRALSAMTSAKRPFSRRNRLLAPGAVGLGHQFGVGWIVRRVADEIRHAARRGCGGCRQR